MKKLIAVAMLSGMIMHAQTPTTLAALRDNQRVLLLFAGDHDPRVEQQWATLTEMRTQAAQRDLTTVLITRSRTNMHDGNAPPQAVFSNAEQQALRARFHIQNNEFTVILIGKDGGEKLRAHQPITWDKLESTIDAMPMRQAEMRHQR